MQQQEQHQQQPQQPQQQYASMPPAANTFSFSTEQETHHAARQSEHLERGRHLDLSGSRGGRRGDGARSVVTVRVTISSKLRISYTIDYGQHNQRNCQREQIAPRGACQLLQLLVHQNRDHLRTFQVHRATVLINNILRKLARQARSSELLAV